MSAAAELRAAAQKLRGRGPEHVAPELLAAPDWDHAACHTEGLIPAEIMHPGVALALAAWLDTAADYADRWPADQQTNSPFRAQALEVARAIGGQQHAGGNAEDCPACTTRPPGEIPYPWLCPAPPAEEAK